MEGYKIEVISMDVKYDIIIFAVVGMVVHCLGEYGGLYNSIPIYDSILHTMLPLAMAYIGYKVLDPYIVASPYIKIPLIACFVIAICGVGWELFEWGLDKCIYFNDYMQISPMFPNPIDDTMKDCVCDIIGAITGTFIYYLRHSK